jgi:hypothetical protein
VDVTPAPAPGRTAPPWLGWLLFAGLALLFLGERVAGGASSARLFLSGVGALLVLGSGVWRARSWRAAPSELRSVEGTLALCHAGCVLALLLYFATTDPALRALGVDLAADRTRRLRGPVEAAWTLVLALSLLPALGAQLALGRRRGERGAARVERIRVLETATAGLVLALAAASLFALGYVVSVGDRTVDLSYFKTATPGSATRALLARAGDPVRALVFFPAVNPVKDQVLGYLRALAAGSDRLTIEEHDRLTEPQLAEQYQIAQDGAVVFLRGDRQERIDIGADPETTRPMLRGLDARMQSTLAPLMRERPTIYLTIGHGELGDSASSGPASDHGPAQVAALEQLLDYAGYTVHDLGLVEGLGTDVPADAAAVLVLGPRRPMAPAEIASLGRYLDRGGSVAWALDPEGDYSLAPFQDRLGVRYVAVPLADEERHMRQHGDDSDRRLIVTNQFSSHAALTTLARAGANAGIMMIGPGHLERTDTKTALFVISSLPTTFEDANRDFRFDEKKEKRGPFDLMAAIEPRGSARPFRALVFASSSLFSGPVLVGVAPNAALAADAVRWLAHDEDLQGTTNSEEDQPVVHTRGQDVALFYAAILGAPVLLLAVGLGSVARRRRPKGGAA